MSDTSHIEWTDATWNPVTGCSKVSQGCKNCYALREWPRLSAPRPKPNVYTGRAFTDVQCHPERLDQPVSWTKPRRIFVNSMSDLFHPDVPDEFIDKVFAIMGATPWHIYQVLTKRPQRMLEWFSERWQAAPEATQRQRHEAWGKAFAEWRTDKPMPEFKLDTDGEDRFDQVHAAYEDHYMLNKRFDAKRFWQEDGSSMFWSNPWPFKNVWLGVSVEDQDTADERIPLLLDTPAAVRFISAEPLLGPVNAAPYLHKRGCASVAGLQGFGCSCATRTGALSDAEFPRLNWVIAGGESGPNARPTHPDWIRSLRDQCQATGVPFFFKQWGEYVPGTDLVLRESGDFDCVVDKCMAHKFYPPHAEATVHRVGKKWAGRMLDGRDWNEYPA